MTLMGYQEREENLACMDVFFMAKIMQEEGFEIEAMNHHETSTQDGIRTCLLYVQERYPYFRIRPSKDEDALMIFTVTLPLVLKEGYRDVKKKFDKIFSDVECYYGEISTKWHYNELHVTAESTIFFHDLLKSIIKECKEIQEKEVSL